MCRLLIQWKWKNPFFRLSRKARNNQSYEKDFSECLIEFWLIWSFDKPEKLVA